MISEFKPTNDYMFKRIFGYHKNTDLLRDLLDAILPDLKIKNVEVLHDFSLEKQLLSDKIGVLDVVATLENKTLVNIEMQMRDFHNTVDRSLFYEAGLFHQNLKKNSDYSAIPKTIGIWILNYDIFDKGPFHETARLKRDYEDIILTDKLELHYIQLPKFKKKCKRISNKLEQWLTFIINDNLEEINMIDNEFVQKAEDELEVLNADEKEKEIARLREKAIRDEAAAMDGALTRGREEGIQEGKHSEKIQIAKKMLAKGMDITTIMEITDLTKSEIENL